MRNKLFKVFYYCYHLGLWAGMRVLLTSFFAKRGKLISYKIPGIRHPVNLRAKTSDEYTFRQIFLNKEYEFSFDGAPGSIIDAGANIGLAAIYFANRYPDCRIICLEPESANFTLLEMNISMYPNITGLKAGLWSKKTYLKIKDEGLGNWGFTVQECDGTESGALSATSIGDIMSEFNLTSIDIAKIDIEGSEKEVLEADNVHDWLSTCKKIVIELHDRVKQGTSAALFRVLLNYNAEVEQKGENLICTIRSRTV